MNAVMKRIIVGTLSVAALSSLVALPAMALGNRQSEARDATINRLTDRFDRSHQDVLDSGD